MSYEKLKDENYKNLGGINLKASSYITGPNQVLDLRNMCFERPGAWQLRPGVTDGVSLPKATFGSTPTSIFQFTYPRYENASLGASFYVFDSGNALWALNGVTQFKMSESLVPGKLDFAEEVNSEYTGTLAAYLYFANGDNFKLWSKFNSVTTALVDASWNYTSAIEYRFPRGSILEVTEGAGGGVPQITPQGTHTIKIMFGKAFSTNNEFPTIVYFSEESDPYYLYIPATISTGGLGANRGFFVTAQNPVGYGYNTAGIKFTSPVGGIEYFYGPTTFGGYSFSPDQVTILIAFQQFSSAVNASGIADFSLAPRFLEPYKNMLFMAGFSSAPSELRHSDVGNFLFYDSTFRIEVKPGEGDEITCLKKFQDTLVVFKNDSIYEVSGDSPETLSVKTVTNEYGCVNNRAAVTFGNKLWFVDKKGICEYNGPDTFLVSYPVQQYFDELDIPNIKALHVKSENQVWFGSSDTVLVYDYDVEAWTIYDKLPINANVGVEVLEYGTSLPMASWITSGTSFFYLSRLQKDVTTDRGSNITTLIKTRFHKRLGDTTQEMWRRLFLDSEYGTTLGPTVTANFYQDYGTSIVDTKYLELGPFQDRIDFGLSARSLSIELICQVNNSLTINGYTIESRFLRSV